ncbi:monovalent cation:proton antiporter family protein [Bacillus taeanensis]|uniref:Sodium:proton antiporter n=1 Tax=Bacillus taeanensis TaxID=273032 RepID=A0A366XUJ6_9BACI|nr:cation:proton antiporter [Bacillus taeanensis]RBW69802.1 sodium:proton antiporter [Bacillus taeanensis]
MELHASFSSLIIVLAAAFVTPIFLKKFRLTIFPVVVAEIMIGFIIGKSGFNIVHQDPWLDTLSTLGLIFLMFLSGVEIDFSIFAGNKKKKEILPNGKEAPNGFIVSSIIFLFIFIVSYAISTVLVFLGFVENAFFMTLVISTISLGVVVPTLKEVEIMKLGIGQIILLITVIADLVTMILLAVFVSFYEGGTNMWLLLILFGAGLIFYLVGKYFRHRTFFETMTTGTVQIGTRAVFTLIMIFVGLSETVGAENILGAFLAGVLVSLLSPNKEMVKQLDSFGYGFLIPIFFVMVGVELDLWSLFKDPSILILIPLLFIGLLLSKIIPVLVLKRWYNMRTVIGAGFLITATLSLVIAAAKIGERIGVIDARMASSLILLAIISCIITPLLFKKFFPLHHIKEGKKRIKIIGANQMTLPLSVELDKEQYDVMLFHINQNVQTENPHSHFNISYINDFSIETLEAHDLFNTDLLVISTSNDEKNYKLASYASNKEIGNIVTRVESPKLSKELKEKGVNVFSAILSSKTMMKALVESPHIADIFTTEDERLYEIFVHNQDVHGMQLRNIPFLGDAIIVRIYRDHESIIPHGDTEIRVGDGLIVTGSYENIQELRENLS